MSRSRRNTLVQLFNEQSGVCPYCMDDMTLERNLPHSATIDHLHAASKGGANFKANYAAVCKSCNQERGNKNLGEWLVAKRLKDEFNPNTYRFRIPEMALQKLERLTL